MAFVVAAVTALFAALAAAGVEFAVAIGLDALALVDAALFTLFGWLMLRCSRFGAVAALVLFVLARISLLAGGVGAGTVMALFIVLAFIGAARGAFAYHRLRAEAEKPSAV